MRLNRYLSILLILLVAGSVGLAQEKEKEKHKQKIVVMHKEGTHGDSLIDKYIHINDGDLPDSLMKKVIIHKDKEVHKKVGRVVIKKSGLFKKNKIVIDFDPDSEKILKVVDNGEEVPESKFHKYQDELEGATEYADLESLHPKMEEVEVNIELGAIADSEKFADLEELILELEHMDSEHAKMKQEHYLSVKKVVELDKLQETIQKILENAGETPPQKIKEIEIRKGKFYLNGEEIEGELGQKCIQAYAEQADMKLEKLTQDDRWPIGDINIHILFD